MKHERKPVVDEPVEGFCDRDLFMSRTDERGVILTGNEVFRRLSGYDWDTLIGAPHRLIRHPDMPKAAFWLMWQTLQAGRPFGAYVKNRAASGRFYWVFAVVVPVDGGYLSVRLKPTTELMATVEGLYGELLQAEAQGATPEEAAEVLLDTVHALGFRDYPAFMTHAFCAEYAARAGLLGQSMAPNLDEFSAISGAMDQLAEDVSRVESLFQKISNAPDNLNILGSRLQEGGAPVQEVARNYNLLVGDLRTSVAQLSGGLSALVDTAHAGRFGHTACAMYGEAIPMFETEETDLDEAAFRSEIDVLRGCLMQFQQQALSGFQQISVEVSRFAAMTGRFRRILSGLAVTRVLCRIESASVTEDTTNIEEVARNLDEFQSEIAAALDRIGQACNKVSHAVEKAL